jgi:hypothetical protein
MAEPNFDPDKYLATTPSTSNFNPDEFLKLVGKSLGGPEYQPIPTGTVVDQIPTGGEGTVPYKQTQDLSTGQKFYQNIVRPVLAPTVEAAGAIGGGLLGGTAGTFGAGPVGTATGGVFGAGLGYGFAKEGLQALDVGLGIKQPRQGAANLTEPLGNVLEGAAFEAGGRVAAPLITKGVNKLIDLGASSQLKAANIARSSLGNDLPQVLDTLKNAPANASVAEITASLENPTWQALIKEALDRDPQFLRKIRLFGEDESIKALSKLAGGSNAAEVRAVLDNAKNALNTMTTPQREGALNRANLGQAVADYEAQAGKLSTKAAAKVQEVRDLIKAGDVAEAYARLDLIKRGLPVGATKYTYSSELAEKAFGEWSDKAAQASLDLGQGARFAQSAADALRSVGIKPLQGNQLSKNILAIADNPSFAGDDVLLGAIKNVSDDVAKWTSSGGVIDARALDAIRKNSVNAAIAQLRPGIDASSQRNLASSVLSDIKPYLIDAIESAGGTGYRKYLQDYTVGMQKIAERKLSGEALRLWKTNKDEFVRLVQNESPEEVEKILGKGRYNIATELADSTMDVLKEQANKRLSQISVNQQISEGQSALTQLLKQQTSVMRLPSWFSFWASAGNKAISELEKSIGNKSMKILTESLKNPQSAADLLKTMPASEKQRITELLTNPSSLREMKKSTEE